MESSADINSAEINKDKERKGVAKKSVSVIVNFFRILKLVWQYDKKYIPVESVLVLARSILPLALTWYSAKFVNAISSGNIVSIYDTRVFIIIITYLSLPFAIGLVEIWYDYVYNKFYVGFSQFVRLLIIDKKGDIDIQTYENSDFNNLMVVVTDNEDKISMSMDYSFWMIQKFVTLVSVVVILFSYKWWIFLFILIGVLPNAAIQIRYGQRKYGVWDAKADVRRRYHQVSGYFSDIATLIEIKIFQSKKFFSNILNILDTTFNTELVDVEFKRSKFSSVSTLFELAIISSVVLYLMNDIINKNLEIGTFIFLVGLITNLSDSLTNVFRGYSVIGTNNNFVSDIFTFLNTKRALKNGSIKVGDVTPVITFENATFKYPGSDKAVLKNFTFQINKGEKIAIVGVNGAGKTTLTKILMRFYDVTSGNIKVNEHNIKDIDIYDLYNTVGHLSQNYGNFKLLVKDLIALGNSNIKIDIERVKAAAKRAGAHDFIMEWKFGYDTQLGMEYENGVEPSVGQWQKLALARMFYKNPRIWVLDEPTASIDAVAEMKVFKELEKLPKDRTVILISHRFNTVKNADRIMVVEDGELKEFDSHDNLMKIRNGIYRKLFNAQKDSFEKKPKRSYNQNKINE